MAHCSSCWKENCKKWSSYSSWRHLCFNSCGLLSLYCANQNQVWACSVLGYLVCLLVSCVWYMGFTNTWCSYYMTVVILFMHISPVFVLLNNYSFPMGASVELHHDAIHD
ncbi:unnamed protein product, partial [Vitis vinifera]